MTTRTRTAAPIPDAKASSGRVGIETFVGSAPQKRVLPWHKPHTRDDLDVQLNVKIPERSSVTLDWLVREMQEADKNVTKRSLVIQAIEEFNARQLKKMGVPV